MLNVRINCDHVHLSIERQHILGCAKWRKARYAPALIRKTAFEEQASERAEKKIYEKMKMMRTEL